MSDQQTTPATSGTVQGQTGSGQSKAIDIERLAEKVYQLMRAEARLARARGQTHGTGR